MATLSPRRLDRLDRNLSIGFYIKLSISKIEDTRRRIGKSSVNSCIPESTDPTVGSELRWNGSYARVPSARAHIRDTTCTRECVTRCVRRGCTLSILAISNCAARTKVKALVSSHVGDILNTLSSLTGCLWTDCVFVVPLIYM